ncbi:HAMP domain-containing sensor histidine kinase [Pseudomonas sp. FW300-N2F2]|uniref:sensor histidine kinase n=1 Tax=Pseudomonas sp. FW300-N2F2 TaxID=2751320 RepID=UPI001A910C1B|nr:HAMP domain-containing sensor histidine kinase [Pseudomonas sp. FW300-N2F2]
MSSVKTRHIRHILETSNFQQAATIAFICLLVALLSVIGSGCVLEAVMRNHVRDVILADVRSVQLLTNNRDSVQVANILRQRDVYDRRSERHNLVVDAHGQVQFGDERLLIVTQCHDGPCLDNWRDYDMTGHDNRRKDILGLWVPLADGGRYFSASDLRPMLERTQVIPLMGGAGLFTVLIGSIVISLRFSLRNLYRIDRVRDTLKRFASGDHLACPPYNPQGDEIDRLGSEIHLGLARINRLMTEVKNVTSHIAHELRTPLTRLQNRLISTAEKVDGDIHAELMTAVGETERIHSLFRAVMRIGDVETGRCAHNFEVVDARALLEDLREYYLPLAEERLSPLVIHADKGLLLWGDRALLFQALANLVDNALKYAPRGSAVTLRAQSNGRLVFLSVADHGPGIAQDLRQDALERFRRLDTSGNVPGNGLGLTLVKAIADLHGGQLQLDDNLPGLNVCLSVTQASLDDPTAGIH